jgi:predicted NBD/HSP70 family sugar kinase
MPFTGDNMMGVKRNNRSAALRILHEEGSLSRKRLAEILGLTPAAITKIVGEMLGEGLLLEGSAVPSGSAGRREILLELNPRFGAALGVLINLRQAIVSAVWLDGTVIFSEEYALAPKAPAEETVAMLSERLLQLADRCGLERGRILGVGVAMRALIGPDDRSIVQSFDTLDRNEFAICDAFEARTGLPAILSNSVRALFAGQLYLEREPELGSQLFLRCSGGIGAALSIHGRIWEGDRRQCAEIGHIPVVREGGKPCHCGKSGCLETIASPAAMLADAMAILSPERTPVLWRLFGEKREQSLTAMDVLEAARESDPGALEIASRAVSALADALKSAVYLLDPGKIILYGDIFEHPYLLSRLQAEMEVGVDAGHAVRMEKSRYNGTLENRAAGLLVASRFLESGGTAL